MKPVGTMLAATLYFGVATVLAEAALAAALWARGVLSPERLVQLAAVAQDVDLGALHEAVQRAARPATVEHFAYEELVRARAVANVDCDLRDMSVDNRLTDMRQMDVSVEEQYTQYMQLKAVFDQQSTLLSQGATDPSLQEVQRQLESAQPKTAKDQLVRILDDPQLDPKQTMQFVITLLKSMSLEKRKKILGEFKGDETDRLYGILREMRRALPEVSLVADTRRQLREITANGATPNAAAAAAPPAAANATN